MRGSRFFCRDSAVVTGVGLSVDSVQYIGEVGPSVEEVKLEDWFVLLLGKCSSEGEFVLL